MAGGSSRLGPLVVVCLFACLICDLTQAGRLAAPGPAGSNSPTSLARDEAEGQRQSSSRQPGPRFPAGPEVGEEPLAVFASSWQNEVYLPCPILDLDEEQTVSCFARRKRRNFSV